MKREPLISVIVPVYGTEKYLRKCLNNIVGQTYKNIELIIVNDATKDNSETIIKEYLNRYDNIKYVRHSKNRGLFRARVSGAEEAEGEYIAFVDSDDYISLDFFRLLVKKSMSTGSDIVVCNTVFEDEDGSRSIKQLYQLCFEKEELRNEEIRDKFFSQSGYCFSWHTIWNKLYSRKLWDKCFGYYKKMDQHLIMTEDLAFSVPLLYNTEKMTLEYSASYFYCKHPNASTDSSNIKLTKFEKNMQDIKLAFDFAQGYLDLHNADEKTSAGFAEIRKKYSRMYRTLQTEKFPDSVKARKKVNDFLAGYYKRQKESEFCFDTVSAKFNPGLDYAKKEIMDPKIKYVSFDIFDTLILRPFYNPTDMFGFLDLRFEELTHGELNIPFRKLRELAEKQARMNMQSNCEDVTLREIYDAMCKRFSLNSTIANKMYELEKEYELRFCTVRKTGKELYDFAHEIGKKIIIVSDMYLEYDTVDEILKKNGFDKHETLILSSAERRLKYSSMLFKIAIGYTKVKPSSILHIGDTWNTDVVPAEKVGIRTLFLPKARECFENIINGVNTNNCAWTEKYIAAPFYNGDSIRKSFGYRTMLAMTANKFFDNPFTSINEKSDFNGNPYFIGYYAVGMHCLGLAKWIRDKVMEHNYSHVYFLARDGYLPMKVFEIYNSIFDNKISFEYLHASRTLTLPFLISEASDLYDLNIERNNHTPMSICKMLSFCLRSSSDEKNDLLEQGFVPENSFLDEKEYYRFIDYIASTRFDKGKLKWNQDKLKKYFSRIKDNSVVFDMGYSGRIQSAVCLAAGKEVDALYVHMDNDKCIAAQKKRGFKVYSFYNSAPASTGIMREYLLSSLSPACIDIDFNDGKEQFTYDDDRLEYPEKFVIGMIQKGAVDFAIDFVEQFKELTAEIDFIPQEVSCPFEFFLRFCKYEDRKIFELCNFEDKHYGNIVNVRADKIFNNQLCDITEYTLPSDHCNITKVDIDISTSAEDTDEFDEENEEYIVPTAYDVNSAADLRSNDGLEAAFFYDEIDQDDSTEDKLLKCAENTNNVILWDSIKKVISPSVIKNWFMTNPGGFEDGDYDVFISTHLNWIQENSDLSYLDKVLDRIGDKILLPVGIGFSTSEIKNDFTLNSQQVKTLSAIAERCKSVGVKGEFSAEVLAKYGIKNSVIIGCPSMYTDIGRLKRLSARNDEPKKLNASFKPFYGIFSKAEKNLLKFFADNEFELTVSTATELQPASIADDKLFKHLKSFEEKKKIYFSAADWLDSFDGAEFAMGMNFYNNVAALYAGVPALFVNYETTGREMCKFFSLPFIEVSEFDDTKCAADYLQCADYTDFKASIDGNYQKYLDFLSENGVEAGGAAGRIIEK